MIKNQKLFIAIVVLLVSLTVVGAQGTKYVAITAIVEHPALDAARQGIIDELKHQGYEEGKNLTLQYQSAQGNNATAAQIARKFVGDKPDVLVGIGTPSAQALVAATRTIPIVFTAITDPVAANLVRGWEASGTNVTGVSDFLPLGPQIALIKSLVPHVQNIGYVYSPGEVNSTTVLRQLREALGADKIAVIAAPAQRTTDISTAVQSLTGRVDVIYTTTDNNVVSAYESLYQAAVQSKILLIASDTSSVARGAAAALGRDYYGVGQQAGRIIARILKGESPGAIVPEVMQKTELHININAAQQQGAHIPQKIIDTAAKVIQ